MAHHRRGGVAGNDRDRRAERGCQLVKPLMLLNTFPSRLMFSPNLQEGCSGMQQYRIYRDYVYIGYIAVMPCNDSYSKICWDYAYVRLPWKRLFFVGCINVREVILYSLIFFRPMARARRICRGGHRKWSRQEGRKGLSTGKTINGVEYLALWPHVVPKLTT